MDQNAGPQGVRAGVMIINGYVNRGQNLLALSSDGKTLATLQANSTIQLWEVASGNKIREIKGPKTGVANLLFSPDGTMLAARGGDRTVYLLATDTGNEIRQIKIQQAAAAGGRVVFFGARRGSAMAFSPDGKTLATAETEIANQKIDTYIRLAEVESGKEIRRIASGGNGVAALGYSADGKTLAYASGTSVHLRESDGVKELRQINSPAAVSSLVFTPDSKSVAVKGAIRQSAFTTRPAARNSVSSARRRPASAPTWPSWLCRRGTRKTSPFRRTANAGRGRAMPFACGKWLRARNRP